MLAYVIFFIGIGILIYSYFLYPLILITLKRFFIQQSIISSELSENVLPTVTIVIAAYNEETVIKKKLENSVVLNYPEDQLKILVASDGSSDKTNDIVQKFANEHPQVSLLTLPRGGKSSAINVAIKKVESEIVVFSDANTEYHLDAIIRLVEPFFNPEIGSVCGSLIYRNPNNLISGEGESFYWRYETALKKLESNLGYVAGANGAIYAIRRDLIDPLPSNTINDDFLISMRIVQKGYKSIYEEKAKAYEDVAPNTKSEFKRHIRDGAGHYIAICQLWRLLNPFLGISSLIYWSHRIFRWMAPFILIALYAGNFILMDQPFFYFLFYLQTAFYLMACLGMLGHGRKLPFLIYVPFYFCNLNLALFIGFLKVITGVQRTTWESTTRK
jgi:poly-beta-1,6-N-acetyl-D-glucosamine synthase